MNDMVSSWGNAQVGIVTGLLFHLKKIPKPNPKQKQTNKKKYKKKKKPSKKRYLTVQLADKKKLRERADM